MAVTPYPSYCNPVGRTAWFYHRGVVGRLPFPVPEASVDCAYARLAHPPHYRPPLAAPSASLGVADIMVPVGHQAAR